MKPLLKIYDVQFAHTPDSSFGGGDLMIPITYFSWYRGNDIVGDVAVITEGSFNKINSVKEKTKIAMIIEPPCINYSAYTWISENHHLFDYILTHNRNMLSLGHKFHYMPFGGCWIRPADRKKYEKTKSISIIVSKKKDTIGQALRHQIVELFGDRIDVFGHGYNPIENKIEALHNYQYTIVVENERNAGWFSEKIIDPLSTFTVPIYYGAPDIGDYFKRSGMFQFKTIDQLTNIIKAVEMKEAPMLIYDQAVKDNFELAKRYVIPEDWLYINFFKPKGLLP